ncbi:MAG: DUF3330 domain-containing protein [Rhodoferax sp.]|uniref:DUF3330 domain-containing protein n=1 Tax=Rhodoferax sp. TaxID=50421 RepID=UPI0017BADE89|nr:DUF3330 domain-containing protein [Rhodoferax sp.]NMM14304.1 DUF3330 domain-containing protein [Rhodoferax sp.]NMM18709.1 DUF3330 domain-containing protein [Rhodoferax sp.]
MANNDKPVKVERVLCKICLTEIPITEAIIPEATDYVAHFCGLDCYEKWKNQSKKPEAPVDKT